MTWMQRLKRVFNIDIEICERCGGQVKGHHEYRGSDGNRAHIPQAFQQKPPPFDQSGIHCLQSAPPQTGLFDPSQSRLFDWQKINTQTWITTIRRWDIARAGGAGYGNVWPISVARWATLRRGRFWWVICLQGTPSGVNSLAPKRILPLAFVKKGCLYLYPCEQYSLYG